MNALQNKDLEIPAFLRREKDKTMTSDAGTAAVLTGPAKDDGGSKPPPTNGSGDAPTVEKKVESPAKAAAAAPAPKKEPPARSGTPSQQKAVDAERAKREAKEGLPPSRQKDTAKVIPLRKDNPAPAKGKAAPAPAKGKATPATPAKGKASAKPAATPAKGKATPAAPAKGKASAKPAKGKVEPAKGKARESSVEKDAYGFKKGSLKSRAAAMYAGPKGATLPEVKAALDSSQLNVLVELEQRGCTVRKKKEKGKGKRDITRYFLSGKPKK